MAEDRVLSTVSDLTEAIKLATEIADAILPFTPAAELIPIIDAVELLATKLDEAAANAQAGRAADAAVEGIEAAADAAELAKFPKSGGTP